MKRLGSKTKTFEEYVAYRQGKIKHDPKIAKEPLRCSTHIRKSPDIPSYGDQVGTIPAKPEMAYTGERKLLGIGTMHKSNMIPIFEQSDAEEIAHMRR